MKIAVTTPTGQIGRKLADELLAERAHEVVLLARKPDQLAQERGQGARIEQGDLEDEAFVKRATAGVDALFWLNPPNYQTTDFPAYYTRLAECAASAISANRINRVVLLSSVGAHLGRGVGPVNSFAEGERILRTVSPHLTILRPAFFMENYVLSVPTIAQAKSIFMPVSGTARVPMIATQDIAHVAARTLADTRWTGTRILPLNGPKDYSFDEAAQILSKALGEPVKHVTVKPEQAKQALQQAGMSDHVIGLFLEMYDAIEQGRMKPEQPRNFESTTPTEFERFAKDVLAPAIRAAQGASPAAASGRGTAKPAAR